MRTIQGKKFRTGMRGKEETFSKFCCLDPGTGSIPHTERKERHQEITQNGGVLTYEESLYLSLERGEFAKLPQTEKKWDALPREFD